MTGEALAQLAALFVSKVGEDGVLDDMVLGAEVVQALGLLDWSGPNAAGYSGVASCELHADRYGRTWACRTQ